MPCAERRVGDAELSFALCITSDTVARRSERLPLLCGLAAGVPCLRRCCGRNSVWPTLLPMGSGGGSSLAIRPGGRCCHFTARTPISFKEATRGGARIPLGLRLARCAAAVRGEKRPHAFLSKNGCSSRGEPQFLSVTADRHPGSESCKLSGDARGECARRLVAVPISSPSVAQPSNKAEEFSRRRRGDSLGREPAEALRPKDELLAPAPPARMGAALRWRGVSKSGSSGTISWRRAASNGEQ